LESPGDRQKHWIKVKNRNHPAFDRVKEALSCADFSVRGTGRVFLHKAGQSTANAQTSAPQRTTKQPKEKQTSKSYRVICRLRHGGLAKPMHAGLVIERQEIAILRQ
jgi:hypothetical protein